MVPGLLVLGLWFWWSRSAHEAGSPLPSNIRPVVKAPVEPAHAPSPVVSAPVELPPPPGLVITTNPVTPTNLVRAAAPVSALTNSYPGAVRNPFEAQVALARLAISPGSIDGAMGSQTRLALRQFQGINHLPQTGALDAPTRALLTLDSPPLTVYTVTTNDLARLQPLGKTWLEKSRQTALEYETELELVGELSHANPALIRELNPGVDWPHLTAGTALQVPEVQYPEPPGKAAQVIIHLSGEYLEALDAETNLLAHFPCSIAAHVEKRPVGLLHVIVVAPHPDYTFDPAVFPESPEAQKLGRKLRLPPGPRNPVGVAWVGLDRPGYGIHGTPAPEQVGRTESHGCFRLANWDAAHLIKLAWVGLPVEVVP
jgi:lipoprotein-anchoring transpeptidase ErfK/SrfK